MATSTNVAATRRTGFMQRKEEKKVYLRNINLEPITTI
jgi:hypothetical protein